MAEQSGSNELNALPAEVHGSAGRVSAADKAKNNLGAQPAVLTAQISITRKATGKVEHYTITGTPVKED
jgi:hypothetical protein